MKRAVLGTILALLCLGAVGAPRPVGALCLDEGKVAADFTLTDLEGREFQLSSARGKVVLLAFWASWCPRCMEELAFLQGLYTGREKDLVVLAINQETQNLSATHVAKLKEETTTLGIQFPILLDK